MAAKRNAQRGVANTGIATILAVSQVAGSAHFAAAAEGLEATVTVSTGLEHVDRTNVAPTNRSEGLRSLSNLEFGLRSETRNQLLSFRADTDLIYNFTNPDGVEFDENSANLNYRIENRATLLRFDASYTDTDIDNIGGTDLDFDETITSDDATGDGNRERFVLRTRLSLGRDGPISAELDHSYRVTNFSGTTDPDLQDTTAQNISATLSFQLSPVLAISPFATWREIDEDGLGAIDQTNQSYGLRASYAISETTQLTGEVVFDENETRGVAVRETDGLGYALGLTHERPNGQISLSFSERTTINGTRREVELGRSFQSKRGDVTLGFGLSRTDGFDTQPFANIRGRYEIDQLSLITVSLSQSAVTDDEINETVQTRLNVDYTRELNQISSINAGLRMASEDNLSGPDESSLQLSLGYRRELGSEWGLVSNYEFQSSRQDGRADRDTKTLFIGLERSFAFRP